MNTRKSAGSIRAVLQYPDFSKLLAALAVSQVGDWLYNVALVALVVDRTGSMLWAGLTTAARIVPIVVLGPVGGVIADRFDRRRVLIGSDLLRLGFMLVLALFTVAHLPVELAPVIAAAATAAAAPYLPCVSASTPQMVSDADLPAANAARSALTALGIIVGPALGGVLLLLGSPALAFAANGITFGLSALAVLSIRDREAFRPAGSGAPSPGLLADIATGAAALRGCPEALRLVGADVLNSVLYGMQTVLLLSVCDQVGLGGAGYGYLFASLGIGALAGTALASRALRHPNSRAVVVIALIAAGLPMPLLAFVTRPVVAVLLVAVSGAGAIVVEVSTETGLQRTLGAEVFGRAYGLALPAILGGIVVGSLIAPVLLSVLGVTGALIAAGFLMLGYALMMARIPRLPAVAAAH
ncbi:MAG TPA: MFS transporter [Streptosporangiaceae bacterium]|jgi:MFS family permease